MQREKGFTLAETLITLVIIGVVAMMTIPTLIANYNDRVLEAKKLKMKSVLTNAFTMLKVIDGQSKLSRTKIASCEDEACFATELKKVLRVSSDIDKDSTDASMEYTFDNGNYEVWSKNKAYTFTLNDGTILAIEKTNDISSGTFSVIADLNGYSSPNTGSKDLCRFAVSNSANVEEQCNSMVDYVELITSCEDGYYLSNNACVPNDVANCKIQTQAGVCNKCNDNYTLRNGACYSGTNSHGGAMPI